jgi:hypothetical protein
LLEAVDLCGDGCDADLEELPAGCGYGLLLSKKRTKQRLILRHDEALNMNPNSGKALLNYRSGDCGQCQ